MTKWVLAWMTALVALACACPSKQGPSGGSGTGSGAPSPAGCDGIRGKVEQLYRAEAIAKEPKRVEDAVADNTAMVMGECQRSPDKVTACVGGVHTIAELENKCLEPLDDEGTEGEALRK